MKKQWTALLLIVLISWSTYASESYARIKILYTSALIPFKFTERKQEYIQSLQILKSYGLINNTYVIESGRKTPLSFFEAYCPNVFYSGTNDPRIRNKGVKEAKSLINAYNHYSFDDNDMIVKLTGRYLFQNDHFFQFLAARPEIDALVGGQDRFQTGCFAMRGKYFREWLQQLDLARLEHELIDIEWDVTWFVEKMIASQAKVEIWPLIGIRANVDSHYILYW